jgi:hypothetical protein
MSYNIEQVNSGYMSLSAAGLALGTGAGTFKTTNTLTYTNNGIFKSKGATDNLAFTAGHTALANSQACLFAVWINASGTVSTTQGPIVTTGDNCPVPTQIKVSCSSSQTFTPGTSTLGTGNTATYTDCSLMPGTAQ